MRISDWSSDVCSSDLIEALLAARYFIDFLPLSNKEEVPERPTADSWDRIEESLDMLIPANANQPYDMHELIRKTVDEGDFFEVQPARSITARSCASWSVKRPVIWPEPPVIGSW